MTTQYTPILKLALPVQGELSGTWGDVVNDNITSMVEQAIAGLSVVNTWTTNSHTLTTANGTTAESRAAMLSLTDSGTALTGAGSVICPALSKIYIAKNSTSYVITLKTSAGTGVAIPVGSTMLLYCDGTNVVEGLDRVTGAFTVGGTLGVTGAATFSSTVSGAFNGTLGATTPASVAATTGTFSGAVESTKFNTSTDRAVLDAPAGDGRFRVSTNSTTYGFFRANTSVIQIGTDSVEPLDFHTNNVFRMRLDASGSLGIGTSSPTDYGATVNTLEVKGASASGSGLVKVTGADGVVSGALYAGGSTSMVLSTQTNHALSFATNNTERMTLSAAGALTTTGAATFGGGLTTGTGLAAASSNAANIVLTPNASSVSDIYTSSGPMRFLTPGGASLGMVLDASGNVGIGTAVAPGINGKGLSIYDALYPRLTFRNDITGDSSASTVGTAAYLVGDDFYLNNQEPAGQMSFGAGGAERMRLDASGRALFGHSAAIQGARVEISAVTDGGALGLFGRASDNLSYIGFYQNGVATRTAMIQANSAAGLQFIGGSGGTLQMTLDGSGNLLVGHTAQVLSSKVLSQFSGATHNGIIINETADTASTTFAAFSLSGTAIGSITRVGATSAVAYNTTSDERLKSNIANSDPVLEKIMQVQVRQYDWTEGNLHQDYGFIAQELAPVLSGIVTEGKEEADMWQLDYSRLTPALLKAIQEQQAIIESLTARIEALEGAN
jgi:hypothetical protein